MIKLKVKPIIINIIEINIAIVLRSWLVCLIIPYESNSLLKLNSKKLWSACIGFKEKTNEKERIAKKTNGNLIFQFDSCNKSKT